MGIRSRVLEESREYGIFLKRLQQAGLRGG